MVCNSTKKNEGASQKKARLVRFSNSLLFVSGLLLLSFGLADFSLAADPQPVVFDTSKIRDAICQLLGLIEGSFGALLMIVSGIGAIMAAAVGSYSQAMSLLTTGCGAFILRALISIWFGPVDYCLPGTQGADPTKRPAVIQPAPAPGSGSGSSAPTTPPPIVQGPSNLPIPKPDFDVDEVTFDKPTSGDSNNTATPGINPNSGDSGGLTIDEVGV